MDHMAATSIKAGAEDVHYCLNDFSSVNEMFVSERL